MAMLKYKAIRDNIPVDKKELVRFSDELFLILMEEKLQEELKEYDSSKDVSELGDIIEVCCRIAELRGVNNNQLEAMISSKNLEKGRFAFNNVWIRKDETTI